MNKNERYTRQTTLPQVGESGQLKLQQSRVLVIGCGGLGCATLPYLVASGIGVIGIMDGDHVSIHNLHRQVLFTDEDINNSKAEVAGKYLQKLNPQVSIQIYSEYLHGENALELFNNYDIIVDATDRIDARYLINDACIICQKPFVHASIYRFQSQISVFNYKNGPSYRCLFPTPPQETQSCAEAGVLGTTVSIAGALQANEVMKMILGIGSVLSGTLLLVDNLTNHQNRFDFKRTEIEITPAFFLSEHSVRRSSYLEYKNSQHILLDVRQFEETPIVSKENLIQIPLPELESSLKSLSSEDDILIFCQTGKRSREAYKILQKHAFKNIFCLHENAREISKILVQ